MIIIAPNSSAHIEEKERGMGRGNMEVFEGRKKGMLTTGNGATQSAPCLEVVEWGFGTRGLENGNVRKRFGPASR